MVFRNVIKSLLRCLPSSKMPPKQSKNDSKIVPRGSQDASKSSQDRSKSPQDPSGRAKKTPRKPLRAPKTHPRGSQEAPRGDFGASRDDFGASRDDLPPILGPPRTAARRLHSCVKASLPVPPSANKLANYCGCTLAAPERPSLQRGGCAKHLESAALPAALRRVRSHCPRGLARVSDFSQSH